MNDFFKTIDRANHIVVVVPSNPTAASIGSASAIYTYLLTLHKKVSFFCSDKSVNIKYSFIPWYDKLRSSFTSSADLAISFNSSVKECVDAGIECEVINIDNHYNTKEFLSSVQTLFAYFTDNEIKINKKMATALYAGLLEDTNGFSDERVNGTIFAVAKQLVESGAESKECNRFIMNYMTLGALRLKAVMQTNMQLFLNAKLALFILKDEDMISSGAKSEDTQNALKEALFLPTVEIALLLKQESDLTLKTSLLLEGKKDSKELESKLSSLLLGEENIDRAKEKILKLIDKETKVV